MKNPQKATQKHFLIIKKLKLFRKNTKKGEKEFKKINCMIMHSPKNFKLQIRNADVVFSTV